MKARCYRCHTSKPVEDMTKDVTNINGYKNLCKECNKLKSYRDRERDKERKQKLVKELPFKVDSPLFQSALLFYLAGHKKRSLEFLADQLNINETQAREVIDLLGGKGYTIDEVETGTFQIIGAVLPSYAFKRIDPPIFQSSRFTIGVVSDSHMNNIHERLDVLECAYDEFYQRGIKLVINAGNITDGFRPRINGNEVTNHRFDDQITYILDHYPQRAGIDTYYLSTFCHEGWWLDMGVDFGRVLQLEAHVRNRKDLNHLGLMEADIPLKGQSVMRVSHPRDGMSYAISYRPQKHVEAYQGGEKPRLLILGHYHKMGLFRPREVWTLLAGTCCDQTGYMRSKGIQADVGYSVLTINQAKDSSISGITYEPRPFYNKPFYASKSYKEIKKIGK